MNRALILGTGAAVLAAAGYLAYTQFPLLTGSATTSYANVNVDLGATPASTACGTTTSHDRIICLADTLKAGLAPDLLAQLQRTYTLAEARKWSNFPPMGYKDRVGPTLGDFTPEQRAVIKAILKEAASLTANEGYDEIEQILNADDYLIATTGEAGFSSSNYHIAFLGTPAATGTWQLYFGGHHFALSNTYKDGVLIGATPSFRGVEPFVPFTQNGRENAPMLQEQAAFAALFAALTPEELTRATLSGSFGDIVAGPQKDTAIPATPEGLRVGDLTPDQQALVLAAVETYVRDVIDRGAEPIMAQYAAELAETRIGFSGSASMAAEGSYARIDGPSVWIEFSLQPGASIEGIHPHSIWRDKGADYGGATE